MCTREITGNDNVYKGVTEHDNVYKGDNWEWQCVQGR